MNVSGNEVIQGITRYNDYGVKSHINHGSNYNCYHLCTENYTLWPEIVKYILSILLQHNHKCKHDKCSIHTNFLLGVGQGKRQVLFLNIIIIR